MSDACVVTYTADCDDCGCDAEWTAIQRPAGNSLSVSCARCGKADRPVADVVPLPPAALPMLPMPAAPPLVALWGGPASRVG